MLEQKIIFRDVKNQILAVIIANTGVLVYGQLFGWFSPSIKFLQSNESPFESGPITDRQESWFGTCYTFGAGLGNVLSFKLSQKYGLKFVMKMWPIVGLIFWLLVLFGRSIAFIYTARVLTAMIGIGYTYCLPIFIAEISNAKIRGSLISLLAVTQFTSITITYAIVPFVSYNIVPYIFLPFPIIAFGLFRFIPDTPQFLVLAGKTEEAEESIRFYKNYRKNSALSDERIKQEITALEQNVNIANLSLKAKIEMLKTLKVNRGLLSAVFLSLIYMGSGGFLIFNYAPTIFKESGSSLDVNTSLIVMGCIQIFGSILSATLIDIVGRRPLLIISTLGCTICLASATLFNYLKAIGYDTTGLTWIPVFFIGLNLFYFSAGIMSTTVTILSESFPAKMRLFTFFITIFLMNTCSTISNAVFPPILASSNLHTCTFILAIISGLGHLCAVFFIKDTTGKELN